MLPDRNLLGQIEAIQVRLDKVYNQKFYMGAVKLGNRWLIPKASLEKVFSGKPGEQ